MAVKSPARPELEAYERAMRAGFPDVVARLSELLGARLVAYIGSVKETRAVHEWAAGAREPANLTQRRLRVALQVAETVAALDGEEVAQAFLQGLNPQLEDRSPARLLKEGDLDEIGPQVLGAARSFMLSG